MVAQERWSLTRGGRKGKFDCIFLDLRLYVYTIPHESSCTGTKNISESAFVQTQNADFGSILVPEPCCVASVLKVIRHISDRTENRTEMEVNNEE